MGSGLSLAFSSYDDCPQPVPIWPERSMSALRWVVLQEAIRGLQGGGIQADVWDALLCWLICQEDVPARHEACMAFWLSKLALRISITMKLSWLLLSWMWAPSELCCTTSTVCAVCGLVLKNPLCLLGLTAKWALLFLARFFFLLFSLLCWSQLKHLHQSQKNLWMPEPFLTCGIMIPTCLPKFSTGRSPLVAFKSSEWSPQEFFPVLSLPDSERSIE